MKWDPLTESALQIAEETGKILKKGFGTHFKIEAKSTRHNLVTEYDLAAQEFIISSVKKRYEGHHFLAEEGDQKALPDKGTLWIIDPLDGTVNFAHGIPFFAVSIAVAIDREVFAGVVHNPLSGESFVAEKGKGAWLGENQLRVSEVGDLDGAFLATGLPYDVKENPYRCIDRFAAMARRGNPIRRLGVASLDLAYVAAGHFDAFWEAGLQTWDMAAGKLLIEEAGGRVTHYDGTAHPLYGYHPTLATNGLLHGPMSAILKEDLS